MEKQVIMPNLPNMGLISVLSKQYDVLTDEFIQRWLYQLYNDHLIDPEYMFISESGKKDLREILKSAPYSYMWACDGHEWHVVDDLVSRYPNQTTGTALYIVVLPTLQVNTLLVGNLALR